MKRTTIIILLAAFLLLVMAATALADGGAASGELVPRPNTPGGRAPVARPPESHAIVAHAPALGLAPSWRWDPRPPGDMRTTPQATQSHGTP